MNKLLFRLLRIMGLIMLTSCAFKFDVTSQRTALENQILGSYKEIDDDLVMVSSVRSLDASGNKKEIEVSDLQAQALAARQNQQFNRDDLDEMKSKQIIGETNQGRVQILPDGVGLAAGANSEQLRLAEILIAEENRDRSVIWQRVIDQSPDLTANNMPDVVQNFVKQMREQALPGHWLQEADGRWTQKRIESGT